MKSRKLVVGLLVMLAVAMSTLTFAYWAGSISGDSDVANESITIGTGKDVTTSVSLGSSATSGVLVPSGRAADSNEANAVESYVITYTVDLADADNGSYDGTSATLDVTYDNVLIGGSATYADSVNIVVGGATAVTVNGSSVTVTITVTLDEPANATEYAAVAGAAITFDVTFAASFA